MSINNERNKDLLRKYLINGDKDAYEELFSSNSSLIIYTIKKVFNRNNDMDRTIDEYYDLGCIGLSNAINTFKLEKIDEIKFSTYAYHCIRNILIKQFRNIDREVHPTLYLDDKLSEDSDTTFGEVIKDDSYNPEKVFEEKEDFEYKKKKIMTSLNKIKPDYRKIFMLYYGLNGEDKVTQVELAKMYGCSQMSISRIVNSVKKFLFNELAEFDDNYEDENREIYQKYNIKVLKQENKSKENKLKNLIKKYGSESVKNAINRVGKRSKKIIIMYYGLDGKGKKSQKQISEILGITVSCVNSSLYNVHKKIEDICDNKNIYKKDSKLLCLYEKYGEEKVKKFIENLDQKSKEIICYYYGINGYDIKSAKDISKKYNISEAYVYIIVSKKFELLEKANNDPTSKKNRRKSYDTSNNEKLLDYYQKYGEETVNNSIIYMKKRRKEVINLYYGLDGNNKKSPKEISEILGITVSTVNSTLYNALKQIEEFCDNINNPKKDSKLPSLYEKYGKQEVNLIVEKLEGPNKDILCYYYGINGYPTMGVNDISLKYNVSRQSVYKIIYRELEKIERIIEDPTFIIKETKNSNKLLNFYEKYGEKATREAMNLLCKKRKDIINLYYGLEGNEKKSLKEISDIYSIAPNSISAILYNTHKQIEKNLNKVNREKNNNKNKLLEYYEKYGEEATKAAFNLLKGRRKEVIDLYFGLDGNEEKSIKEISGILGVSISNVSVNLFNAHKQIKDILNVKNNDNLLNLKEEHDEDKINDTYLNKISKERNKRKQVLYSKLVSDNTEIIEEAITKLNDKSANLIKLYFAYEGFEVISTKEISKRINIDEEYLKLIIKQIIENLNQEIKDIEEEKLSSEELKEIRRKEFNNALVIKDKDKIIKAIKSLKKDEYKIVMLYYGVDSVAYVMNDISEILKKDKESIRENLNNIINKINNLVKKRM